MSNKQKSDKQDSTRQERLKKTVFSHFRINFTNYEGLRQEGYVTLAFLRPSKDATTDTEHTVSAAFCSPYDQSSKARGREIALGRLFSGRKDRTVKFKASSTLHGDIIKAGYRAVLGAEKAVRTRSDSEDEQFRPFVPDWFLDATEAEDFSLTPLSQIKKS